MLKSPKIAELKAVPPTHDTLFVDSYDELRKWALQLPERDHELAADLLHDAYVQFTLARPDLESIGNPIGYLYVVTRNPPFILSDVNNPDFSRMKVQQTPRVPGFVLNNVENFSCKLALHIEKSSTPNQKLSTHDKKSTTDAEKLPTGGKKLTTWSDKLPNTFLSRQCVKLFKTRLA